MPKTPHLGRRIVVWGATGSGKTTLARRIGEALGLGVIELDAIRHARGWDSVDYDEMRAVMEQRLASLPGSWVIDGSYSMVHHVYLAHADTLVWLHLPWRVSFWRLLERTVRRARTREPVYHEDGPRESLRQSFLSRRSILWWSISHHRTGEANARSRIAGLPAGVRVLELRSSGDVRRLVEGLSRRASPSA